MSSSISSPLANPISENSPQQILNQALLHAGPANGLQSPDTEQLSPLAQLLHTLQQLQLLDPAKFRAITGQIVTNLQSSAQTALQQGNSTLADQLKQLSTDVAKASQTGQVSDVKGLAEATAAHHHHHLHAAVAAAYASAGTADPSGATETSGDPSSSTTGISGSGDVLSIITDALTSAAAS